MDLINNSNKLNKVCSDNRFLFYPKLNPWSPCSDAAIILVSDAGFQTFCEYKYHVLLCPQIAVYYTPCFALCLFPKKKCSMKIVLYQGT